MDQSTLTLNTNGEATGGTFMLPIGADISLADVVFADNTAANFTLTLTSSGQDVAMGVMPNQSILAFETLESMLIALQVCNTPLLCVAGQSAREY